MLEKLRTDPHEMHTPYEHTQIKKIKKPDEYTTSANKRFYDYERRRRTEEDVAAL